MISIKPGGQVLFLCSRNMVRSPMAAALFNAHMAGRVRAASAGVEEGGLVDGFAVAVMHEMAIDISDHESQLLSQIDPGLYDWVITLSPDAEYRARIMAKAQGWQVEHWPIPDPSQTIGPRDFVVQTYRSVRSLLATKIAERFL